MKPAPAPVFQALRDGLDKAYGERLRGLYMYGSYARGEEETQSDLDVLVVLDDVPSYWAEIERTSHLISRLSLEHAISISRTFVSERDWENDDSPFLNNVRRENVTF